MLSSVARVSARAAARTVARRSMMASSYLTSTPLDELLDTFSQTPEYIAQAPATETSKLGNGMRVASEFNHDSTTTLGVFVDTGSRYESAETNGVAHFLEHLAFKGTEKRTREQLEREIENLGGQLNAYTTREMTVYFAQVLNKDVPAATEMLSDILLNSTFSDAAVESERGVILREMEAVGKQHNEMVFEHLHSTAYRGTPLGAPILGPEENVRRITGADLRSFVDTHYTAPRMVLASAGGVQHQQLAELADKHFSGVPTKPRNGTDASAASKPPRGLFTGSDIRVRYDSMKQAHVAVAVETDGHNSPHAFPLMVMQSLLGEWARGTPVGHNSSSKLARLISEQPGAVSASGFNTTYSDTGLFGVYFVAGDTDLHECMFHTMHCLSRLSSSVTDEELWRAQTQLKAQLLTSLEGSTAVCEDIGRQTLVYGRRMPIAELIARIDAVDLAAVKATARKFITDRDVALAGLGPVFELPDYNWVRGHTYSLLE